MKAKEDDSRNDGARPNEGDLAEVLVKGQKNSILFHGVIPDLFIRRTGRNVADPRHVMPSLAKRLDYKGVEVFVGEKTHGSASNLVYLLHPHEFVGKGETGENVLVRHMRIVLHDLLLGPAVG